MKHPQITNMIAVTIASVFILTFCSCNKQGDVIQNKEYTTTNDAKTLILTNAQRDIIAQNFALAMGQHPNSYTELYNAISHVHYYGVDEIVYLYDIIHPELSVFLPSSQPLTNLTEAIIASNLLIDCNVLNSPYLGQLQFYWPYMDDWDHLVSPIIIFEPTNSDNTIVHGYKYVNNTVQEINIKISTLDELLSNTCIIIKEAEINYNIYPDFKNGVFTKNGITWLRPTDVVGQDGTLSYEDQTTNSDTVFEASFYKFMSSGTQYDSWFFGGGSEYALTIARLLPNGVPDTCTFMFTLTRKEIKHQIPKNLENPKLIHPNWMRNCEHIHYRFFEYDGGGSVDSIQVGFSYEGTSISTYIKIRSTDDLIENNTLLRDTFFNWCQTTGNNNQSLGGNEVFWFKMRAYSPTNQ